MDAVIKVKISGTEEKRENLPWNEEEKRQGDWNDELKKHCCP